MHVQVSSQYLVLGTQQAKFLRSTDFQSRCKCNMLQQRMTFASASFLVCCMCKPNPKQTTLVHFVS